jgi:hypothetical protein
MTDAKKDKKMAAAVLDTKITTCEEDALSCKKCEEKLPAAAKFCLNCGAKVEIIKPKTLSEILQIRTPNLRFPIWCGKHIKETKLELTWKDMTDGCTYGASNGSVCSLNKSISMQYGGNLSFYSFANIDPGCSKHLLFDVTQCGTWKKKIGIDYSKLSFTDRQACINNHNNPFFEEVNNPYCGTVVPSLTLCKIPHLHTSDGRIDAYGRLEVLVRELIENKVQIPRVGRLFVSGPKVREGKEADTKTYASEVKFSLSFHEQTEEDFIDVTWSSRAFAYVPGASQPSDPTGYEG